MTRSATSVANLLPGGNRQAATFDAARRWAEIGAPAARSELFGRRARDNAAAYANNIENYIGTVSIPVGITGPLRMHGSAGSRDFRVPLATTEAALVASYSRGASVISHAGGCTAMVVDEGVSRTPLFAFDRLADAHRFAAFVKSSEADMALAVERVTRFGRLRRVACVHEGNNVYVDFCFTTGDAAGQNMVTFATDRICRHLIDNAPVRPNYWFLEANLSGDKKATARSLSGVRGKRVIAEVTLAGELVRKRLHTTPRRMQDYWRAGALGGVLCGTTGVQGHFANGLAALYLACGQDVACVAESATGVTRMETTPDDGLYVSVTLPNVMVGTVGGGTGLPGAAACLGLLDLAGKGKAATFAELAGALVLAGEISIIAAFCSGDFARAHHALSRGGEFERSGNDE